MTKSSLFTLAHKNTREVKKVYPEINYITQFGLELSMLYQLNKMQKEIKFEDLKIGMKLNVNVNDEKKFQGEIIEINEKENLLKVSGYKFKSGKDFPLWIGITHIENIIKEELKMKWNYIKTRLNDHRIKNDENLNEIAQSLFYFIDEDEETENLEEYKENIERIHKIIEKEDSKIYKYSSQNKLDMYSNKGLINTEEKTTYKILHYNRQLTYTEIKTYELIDLN